MIVRKVTIYAKKGRRTHFQLNGAFRIEHTLQTIQTSTYTIQTDNAVPYNVVMSTNPRGNTTVSWSDALGRAYKVVPPTGPAVTYTYDAADRLVAAQYGAFTTTLTYDIAGRKLAMDDPDMGYWTYQYDALGNLTQQTDARGCVTELDYDGLNRLLEKNYSNASGGSCATIAANTSSISYTYDQGTNGIGRRTSMGDGSGNTLWGYDPRGRLVTETVGITGVGTYSTNWTYNSADLLAGMTYPNGEVVFNNFNSQGLVTALNSESWVSYAMQAKYDEAGRLLEWTLGNGVQTSNIYNSWTSQGGRLQSTSSTTNLTPAATWQNLEYSYDTNGNLSTIQDTIANETLNYTYDVLDRLTGVSGAYSQIYGYNAATGNLENKAGQTLIYTDTAHPHAATGMGNNIYTYDANGNMTSRQISSGTYTLNYDAEGRLVGISGGGMTAAYTYNGDGERVKAVITIGSDTKTTTYIGDYFEVSVGEPRQLPTPTQPDCSTNYCVYFPLVLSTSLSLPAGHAWMSYYSVNGQRVAMRVKSNQDGVEDGVYYFLTDHLGSTAITLASGANKVAELRYSAWGETRFTDGNTPTQRRYTGQLQTEAGLYFYNARWFDPSLGRFSQADTIVPLVNQGVMAWDRYAGMANNPLRYNDPTGHCIGPLVLVCAGIALIGIAISIAQINTGLEEVQVASAQPQMVANEQVAVQQWQENCMGQCHYSNVASVTPDVVVGGTRPESPMSDLLGMGYFDITQGTIGLVGSFIGLAKVGTSAFQPRPTVISTKPKLETLVDDISDWVSDGGEASVIRNKNGDFILLNDSNTRKFRFDFFNTSPHENPHFHIEWIDEAGDWVGPRIYPSDVDPR